MSTLGTHLEVGKIEIRKNVYPITSNTPVAFCHYTNEWTWMIDLPVTPIAKSVAVRYPHRFSN